MRLYKRWLVAVIVFLFALNSCAIPLPANATDDGTATVTSVAGIVSPSADKEAPTTSIEPAEEIPKEPVVDSSENSEEEPMTEKPATEPAEEKTVKQTAGPAEEETKKQTTEQAAEPAAESTVDNEPQSKIHPQTKSCVSGKYTGSTDFIPGYTMVKHQDPVDESSPVDIKVDENFCAVVDSRATANTGNSDAAGTKATNTVGGTSQATAVDGSGEPIDPGDSNFNGTYAGNEVIKSIGNTGTASAVAGTSEANNAMKDNEANIAPETFFSSEGPGKIIDSKIKVNAKLNYWALISGLSEASSGDSSATGTSASNLLTSNDDAIARGETSPSSDGDILSGDVVSVNDSENSISNDAEALAATGASKADNIMEENDIAIAPSVEAVLNICGDVIKSNVTVNLAYNFLAVISGLARASTGNSEAAGAVVNNEIDNQTNSTAVGDSSSNSAGDGSRELPGGAVATNDTSNGIENAGSALGLSGDANALNSMIENAITIAPVVCNRIDILEPIINANVVINIAYNFWATISGQADAESGSADANGLVADNSINNESSSLAIGDSDGFDSQGDGSGNSTALNDTDNNISNKGDGSSASGDGVALNTMLGNTINLSPVIATAVVLITPLADDNFVIDVVYDIWTSLDGSANAKTGNTASFGAICDSSIDSRSKGVAVAKIGSDDGDGSALAINSSDNDIGTVGNAAALSGHADAASNMSDSFIGMTGCLTDDVLFGNSQASKDSHTSFKAGINEGSEALSGDAAAVGVAATSQMRSDALSKDIFGDEGVSVNDSDDDIFNEGKATADSGDALARSGLPRKSDGPDDYSDDIVLVGLDRPDYPGSGNENGGIKIASASNGSIGGDNSGGNIDNAENVNNKGYVDNVEDVNNEKEESDTGEPESDNNNDQSVVGNSDGDSGKGNGGKGGFSLADIFKPDKALGYFESVASVDYCKGLPIPPITPLWPRGIFGLFIVVTVLVLTLKPWRSVAHGR